MKHFRKLLCCALITFIIISCSKNSNSGGSNTKPVDDVALTFEKINTPVTPDHLPINSAFMVKADNIIYYAASFDPSGNSNSNTQFMLAYDIPSNSFSSKSIVKEICSCGPISSTLSSDGTDLYYFADNALKYTAAT